MIRHPEQDAMDLQMAAEVRHSNEEFLLVQQVIQHDEQAFARLYGRYAPALQRFLSRSLQQACLVEEVLNDVMLVLWQEAARFPRDVPVGAWLHGIARHKAWKALRRQTAYKEMVEEAVCIATAPVDPETLLLQNEQATQLSHELGTMSSTDRLLLEKLLYQGCSYQEMAAQTNTPLNTVKTRIARARQRLLQRYGSAHLATEAA